MPPNDIHQEERHKVCTDPEAFRLYVAVWLGEFRHLLTGKLPIEAHLQDFISGIHRFDRLGMRQRYPEVVVEFVKRAGSMIPREGEQEPAPIAVATAALVEMASAGVVSEPAVSEFVQRHREALFRQMIGATDPLPAANSTGLGSVALVVRAAILAERTSPRQPIASRHLLAAILALDETLPPLASLPRGDGSDRHR